MSADFSPEHGGKSKVNALSADFSPEHGGKSKVNALSADFSPEHGGKSKVERGVDRLEEDAKTRTPAASPRIG